MRVYVSPWVSVGETHTSTCLLFSTVTNTNIHTLAIPFHSLSLSCSLAVIAELWSLLAAGRQPRTDLVSLLAFLSLFPVLLCDSGKQMACDKGWWARVSHSTVPTWVGGAHCDAPASAAASPRAAEPWAARWPPRGAWDKQSGTCVIGMLSLIDSTWVFHSLFEAYPLLVLCYSTSILQLLLQFLSITFKIPQSFLTCLSYVLLCFAELHHLWL